MTAPFTRRELLGIGGGFAAAATGSVAGIVGLAGDGVLDRPVADGADRLAAWTPASEAFEPDDVAGPYRVTYADLPRLRRTESAVDGRLRAVPHRWLTRLSRVTGVDVGAAERYLQASGRGILQVHERDHDRERLGEALETLRYELAAEVGGFDVYAQSAADNTRELRTIPHLDDAIAVDGDRIVSCGRPGLDDPVPPLVSSIRARLGGPRLVERDDALRRLLSGVDEADLLTVSPVVREWVEDGPPGLDGLRGFSRAVRFEESGATVRSVLLYGAGATPETATIRSLFLDREAGSQVGVAPVDRVRVETRGNVAVVTARTPLAAFTEGAGGRQIDSTVAAYSSREIE